MSCNPAGIDRPTVRTKLTFFILKTEAGWIIRADGFVYPPCATYGAALVKAVREAQAAGRLGFASVVLTQPASGDLCRVCWTYDRDGRSPHLTTGPGAAQDARSIRRLASIAMGGAS